MSKVDPSLVDYVLKGGQLPGIPKETMDGVIQNYMKKVYEAAAAAQSGKLQKGQEKVSLSFFVSSLQFLVPMDKLPKQMVQNVVHGDALPGLTPDQTRTVTEYYTKSVAVVPSSTGPMGGGESGNVAQMAELWKLLPPGYNISRIPEEVWHLND